MRNDPDAPPPAPDARPGRRTAGQQVAHHAKRLNRLQVGLLVGFLVLGLVGAGVYAAAWWNHPASAQRTPARTDVRSAERPTPPAGSSGFVGSAPAPADTSPDDNAKNTKAVVDDSWSAWSGQKGAALGFGFVGGFVVGFAFRAFLKLMTLAALVVGGGLAALTYFHVVNIDLTAARHAYDSNAAWLTEQATRLRDLVVAHLPTGGGSAAGLFFGFRRR